VGFAAILKQDIQQPFQLPAWAKIAGEKLTIREADSLGDNPPCSLKTTQQFTDPLPAQIQTGSKIVLAGLNLSPEEVAVASSVEFANKEPENVTRLVTFERRRPLANEKNRGGKNVIHRKDRTTHTFTLPAIEQTPALTSFGLVR
jgi:hypothetical protein